MALTVRVYRFSVSHPANVNEWCYTTPGAMDLLSSYQQIRGEAVPAFEKFLFLKSASTFSSVWSPDISNLFSRLFLFPVTFR